MNTDEMLDTPSTAKFLNVPIRTVETWRYRGGGPRYLRLSGRVVRYRLADLIAFLERSAVEPRAE
jgi:hypothetical protein